MKKLFYIVLTIILFVFSSCSAVQSNSKNEINKNDAVEDTYSVKFIIENLPSNTPEYSDIYMMGDFNGWNPSDIFYKFKKNTSGEYILNVSLKAGTIINFKITRGSLESVESDSFGNDIDNREYIFSVDGDENYISIDGWRDLGF